MKEMRFLIITLLIITIKYSGNATDSLNYKKRDRFRVHLDFSTSSTSFKLMGTSDVGSGNLKTIDNRELISEPKYKYREKRIFTLNINTHLGLNIPFYRCKNWSTGIKSSFGLGYQYGILASNFSSVIFDLPQYAYYRNYKSDLDYTLFAGYKFTLAPVSYGLFIIGVDYNLDERNALRFFFSPYRRTYYSQLTNGDLKPTIRVIEFGFGFVF
jgi:hypothetical protein